MKNLIIALSLFLALGASAQTKTSKTTTARETTDPKIAFETAAQKDVNNLIAFTPVSSETQTALKELFINKHITMKDIVGLSQERKDVVVQGMEYRLSILLEPATFEKLKSNKDLYRSLIN